MSSQYYATMFAGLFLSASLDCKRSRRRKLSILARQFRFSGQIRRALCQTSEVSLSLKLFSCGFSRLLLDSGHQQIQKKIHYYVVIKRRRTRRGQETHSGWRSRNCLCLWSLNVKTKKLVCKQTKEKETFLASFALCTFQMSTKLSSFNKFLIRFNMLSSRNFIVC